PENGMEAFVFSERNAPVDSSWRIAQELSAACWWLNAQGERCRYDTDDSDFRHDVAGWRAVAGSQYERGGKSDDRQATGPAGGGHHRSRLRLEFSWRFRSGAADRPGSRRAHHLQSCTGEARRHRSRVGSVEGRAQGPHPYVSLDLGYPFEIPVPDDAGRSEKTGSRNGPARAGLRGRRGVLADGRQPVRSLLFVRSLGSGDR